MDSVTRSLCILVIGGAACVPSPSPDRAVGALSEPWRSLIAGGTYLPSDENPLKTAWGGADPLAWRPEAIAANAASLHLNRAWMDPTVVDALVAISVQLVDSGFRPYGDGQTNSELGFGPWWSERRPPVIALLRVLDDGTVEVELRFNGSLVGSRTAVEVAYRPHDEPGGPHRFITLAAEPQEGELVARWTDIPAELDLADPGQLTPLFVRPSPGYDDWFPVYFRLPRHSVAEFVATVPPVLQSYPFDGKPFADPEGFHDDGSGPLPIDRARTATTWTPGRYNVGHGLEANGSPAPYVPENVHAFIPGAPHRVDGATAVGKGFTWVAEARTHLKLMYTGFERRRVDRESLHGVPSGSGWHVMGDTITLANTVERFPLLVGAGFTNPAVRFAIGLPGGGFSYGLDDVAVFRLLMPGEVFVTVPTLYPARDQDHQWYAIPADHDFLAEEWVHPTRPTGDNPAFP